MKVLQLFGLLAVILVFSAASVSAKGEWTQVRSKNFYLIGNASERDIRKVATKLEQFRETFRQLFKSNLNSPIPTNVVVFKNASAYKPFQPVRANGKVDTNVAGYFQSGDDVNYITLSTEGEDADTYGTIFHEYVHFILDTNFGKTEVPPWFNEGLAEYYQTFAIEEDQKVKLGLPQSVHLQLLQQSKLIPFETFFTIDNYSLHQNGNHSQSIFYAQAWALIHYLIQSGKTEGLEKFLSLRMKNVPAEKAFQESFQSSYAQLEKDLKKYVEQNTYKYSMITFKNKLVFDGEMQSSQLSEATTNAYLGDLLYHTNRADDAESYLQKALAGEPELSMANTTYGMVKLRQRKFDEAKKYLDKAISEDQKNHLAFFHYAQLLSREDRDELGYVSAFPAEKTAKMRDLLKRAIAINPSFTESYELLAFLSLVNNEQLDEAVSYLQKALKYQPGNQRYILRIAEIYLRQDKFKEAADITEKIAKTADEPEIKSRAENLAAELKQRQDFAANRKQYETALAEARKNGGAPVFVRGNSIEKPPTPEELAKLREEAEIRSANEAIRKPADGETRVIGRIERIECKGKAITYAIKAENETFTLTSKDFENLALTSLLPEANGAEVGCGASLSAVNAVLTYKTLTDAKAAHRGELIAIDFVADNFRFMDVTGNQNEAEFINAGNSEISAPANNQDFETQRREAMMQALKNAMRQPLAGEKREIGFIEKIECGNKGMFFFLKTQTQTFKFTAASPQAVVLRAFTPELEQLQFGCGMKSVNVPVVFTYKETANGKNNTNGEIVALEFVPKSFTLEK